MEARVYEEKPPREYNGGFDRSLIECEGKVAFDSYTLANQVVSRRSKSGRTVYKCKTCRKFHVGKKTKPFRKKRNY